MTTKTKTCSRRDGLGISTQVQAAAFTQDRVAACMRGHEVAHTRGREGACMQDREEGCTQDRAVVFTPGRAAASMRALAVGSTPDHGEDFTLAPVEAYTPVQEAECMQAPEARIEATFLLGACSYRFSMSRASMSRHE